MKILLIHSDYIEFEARQKAIKLAEDWKKGEKTRIEECLVVFTAVEKQDEGKVGEITKNMVDEVEKVANEIKADTIVFYPYAHLSKDLSSPGTAKDVLLKAEELAKEKGFTASHAPFGWYKKFSISAKGHPLSELSREISAEGKPLKKKRGGVQPVKIEEAKELSENDHRILGKKLDLYSFNEVAPGMIFYHPKGTIIRNELLEFLRKERTKNGYKEISTPVIMNKTLWETSGHWDHYADNMFFTNIDESEFAVKPMNCPGAMLVFNSETRSYRDLPLRFSEYGMVHRNELSGVLSGLFRVRQFVQDDAHIFVTEDQLEKEVENIVDLVDGTYKIFGFDYNIELSTRPDDALGTIEIWDRAEKALGNALKKKKIKYKINEKDGAFYGPKIDFHIKDSLGRTWQCATIQADFNMPERFDINYIGDDNKQHRPVVIHTVTYGALERFIGILVEHYKGAFPVWLSPIQVRVLPLTDKNNEKSLQILEELNKKGFRADIDNRSSTVDYRVREGELQKIPYIVVIGEKEEQNNTIAVRTRGKKIVDYGVNLKDFIKNLKNEIKNKK